MAMRAELEERVTYEEVMTGLLWPVANPPVVNPPDSIEHYRVTDGSIVEVIRREYAPGKFTASIHQTWEDGSV